MSKKKLMGWFATVSIAALLAASAYAENMEVQIIGGPEGDVAAETVSLDDIKLNAEIDIDDYAIIVPTEYQVQDTLYLWKDIPNKRLSLFESGSEAEYILLYTDITNLSTGPHDFLKDCTVKVVYDDKYEYAGWSYQYNHDNLLNESSYRVYKGDNYSVLYIKNDGSNDLNLVCEKIAIPSEDNFSINQMYTGHYAFGCTVPNSVVNSKAPLRMEIEIDGNELTYNIRK